VKHVAYLDGWRGLAILCVLLEHFFRVPSISMGRLGVDLFFVLSGLLMSRILFEDRVDLGTFYRRRISRVFPVFALYVAVVFAVFPWQPGELVPVLTFTRSYTDPPIWQSEYPIGHLWSLAVEEHSYVILATLAVIPLVRYRKGFVLVGCGLLTFAAIALYLVFDDRPTEPWAIRTEAAATCLMLSAGYRQIRLKGVPAWAPVLALALGVACYLKAVPIAAKVGIAPFLLAFAMNHIGETYAGFLKLFENRALVMVGLWSYSLYLWQQPFYKLSMAGYSSALMLLAAFVVSLASYYVFESPIRCWLNEHWRPKRQALAT
jgi:peptidoglycan/LPS O-acetylase OafA/YrhL